MTDNLKDMGSWGDDARRSSSPNESSGEQKASQKASPSPLTNIERTDKEKVTDVLGPTYYSKLPEKTVNKLADLIETERTKAVLAELEQLNRQHTEVCGVVYVASPRDDCSLPRQLEDRIAELRGSGDTSPPITEENRSDK